MSRRKLAAVAEATYRLRAGTATRRDTDLLDQVALQLLPGGYNNPLYRLRLDGRDLCLKLPVVDNRHRAQREWQTLTLLARRGRPLAPQPVWRAFAATWEDLGPDHYRADGGRHRQSRDATFDVTGS